MVNCRRRPRRPKDFELNSNEGHFLQQRAPFIEVLDTTHRILWLSPSIAMVEISPGPKAANTNGTLQGMIGIILDVGDLVQRHSTRYRHLLRFMPALTVRSSPVQSIGARRGTE